MSRRLIGMGAIVLSACLYGGYNVAVEMGFHVNLTDSAPHGIWRTRPLDRQLTRGDLVEVCAPDQPLMRIMEQRGYIETGSCNDTHLIPFLKPVAAVAGDTVVVQHGHDVIVNGLSLPHTNAMPNIPAWPDGTYTVEAGTIWVLSSYSAGSLDSRYFGPVPLQLVNGLVQPILVAGDVSVLTPWRHL